MLKHLEMDPGPHLVVVPASLLENWERWAPPWHTCAVLAQACVQGLLLGDDAASQHSLPCHSSILCSESAQLPVMLHVTSSLYLKVQAAKYQPPFLLQLQGLGMLCCYISVITCCRELERWCPSLKVVKYYGKDRALLRQELDSWRSAPSGRVESVALAEEMKIREPTTTLAILPSLLSLGSQGDQCQHQCAESSSKL